MGLTFLMQFLLLMEQFCHGQVYSLVIIHLKLELDLHALTN